MNRPKQRAFTPLIVLTLLASASLTLAGCTMFANIMHVVGADKIPPQYDGLEDTRLAVMTVTDSSQYSDDVAARLLSRKVGSKLTKEVDDLRLVREDQVEQWRDTNGWDSIDFVAMGRDVDAEKVLSIELANLRLRDGATLYRGRADVTVKVIDVASGDILFRDEIDDFTYPISAGQHTSETTESRFRKLYLGMLGNQIGRLFHPYDQSELFALDGKIASQ